MPRRPTAPRHRAARRPVLPLARIGLAVVALAVTGATVAVGISVEGTDVANPAAYVAGAPIELSQADQEALESRGQSVSRSDRRGEVDPAKARLLAQETRSGGQSTEKVDLGGGDPRTIAQALLGEFGFSSDQFSCLDSLWTKESGWNPYADNPSSSAYGIPQALPGSKMASAGADWATNPATQIRWGLGYIRDRYGSPCGAWGHSQSVGWY